MRLPPAADAPGTLRTLLTQVADRTALWLLRCTTAVSANPISLTLFRSADDLCSLIEVNPGLLGANRPPYQRPRPTWDPCCQAALRRSRSARSLGAGTVTPHPGQHIKVSVVVWVRLRVIIHRIGARTGQRNLLCQTVNEYVLVKYFAAQLRRAVIALQSATPMRAKQPLTALLPNSKRLIRQQVAPIRGGPQSSLDDVADTAVGP